MRVVDLIKSTDKTAFSFEILPPLKGTGIEKLYKTVDTLREFDPKYINITTHRSEYVYKDLGGKLQLAVWDFNNGFDNYQGFRTETDVLHTVENSWFQRLWQDENFRDRVCERYRQLRETTLADEHIAEKIASYQEELGEAVDRNFKVWGYSFKENLLAGTSKEGTSRNIRSYEEAMKQLTDTIRERLAYLDKELGEN